MSQKFPLFDKIQENLRQKSLEEIKRLSETQTRNFNVVSFNVNLTFSVSINFLRKEKVFFLPKSVSEKSQKRENLKLN